MRNPEKVEGDRRGVSALPRTVAPSFKWTTCSASPAPISIGSSK